MPEFNLSQIFMKLLLVIISIFIFQKSKGQDSIHVLKQYEYNKPKTLIDSFFHQHKNTIFISLDEGFDDSVYVTIRNVPILNKYLKTNESIGYAGSFGVSFDDSSDVKELKIIFVKANRYIKERLNLKFKSLQVRGLNPWLLIYTNQFPMRE